MAMFLCDVNHVRLFIICWLLENSLLFKWVHHGRLFSGLDLWHRLLLFQLLSIVYFSILDRDLLHDNILLICFILLIFHFSILFPLGIHILLIILGLDLFLSHFFSITYLSNNLRIE